MTISQLRKLLEDADPEGNVVFYLGDVASPMTPREWYATSTKDSVYIEMEVPDGWRRE